MFLPHAVAQLRSARVVDNWEFNHMRVAIVVISCLVFSICSCPQTRKTSSGSRILGKWHGSSICIDTKTDVACKDEEIIYSFVPDTVRSSILLHGFKVVNGKAEPMYDLDLDYSDSSRVWSADYIGRIRIRWSYQIKDTLLSGTLIELPTGRLIRRVIATKYGTK